jgi:hypothetical protein
LFRIFRKQEAEKARGSGQVLEVQRDAKGEGAGIELSATAEGIKLSRLLSLTSKLTTTLWQLNGLVDRARQLAVASEMAGNTGPPAGIPPDGWSSSSSEFCWPGESQMPIEF